jgi:predicted DNA-binding transcriptional regulator AlpA
MQKFLRRKAILDRFGISNSSLYAWIQAGKFPAPIKLVEGGAASVWLASEIEKFEEARIAAAQSSQEKAI